MTGQLGRRTGRFLAASLAFSAVLTVAGCGTADRANKTGDDTVVLSFGTIDDLGHTPAPAEFIRRLTALSGGKIKIQVKGQVGAGGGDADTQLVDDISSDAIDLGIPVMRGFAAAGFAGFEALEAPMVLTSYEAQKALVRGPLADRLLNTLDNTKLIGLALTPGTLRRPFSSHPLRSPQDWQRIRFRSYSSIIQDATITALGATPVRAGYKFPDRAAEGKLDGAELDVAGYAQNHYTLFPVAVRNIVLWPRMTVFTMNRVRFDNLTEAQRGEITTAVADAVRTAIDFDYEPSDAVTQACKLGVSYYDASEADLAAMKKAVKPVLESIAANPIAGPLLSQIEAVAARYPTSVPVVPETCFKR